MDTILSMLIAVRIALSLANITQLTCVLGSRYGELRGEARLSTFLTQRQTSCCLTFSLYMLSEHPVILARLREEILEAVGPDRQPTLEDIRELKLLRAVINGEHLSLTRTPILPVLKRM